jgi:membrane protein
VGPQSCAKALGIVVAELVTNSFAHAFPSGKGTAIVSVRRFAGDADMATEQDRRCKAEAPWQIPARGWAHILRRAWKETGKRNLSLFAGGVTYYLLLALFPALAAVVSVYGLVADPAGIAKSAQSLSGMLPPSTVKLIGDELARLVSGSSKSLGLGVLIGIAIALWSGVR